MTKRLTVAIALLAVSGSAFARGGSHRVRSYTTKRGTYIQSHRKTNPNHSKRDNWSTKGSVNPYTGKAGTK